MLQFKSFNKTPPVRLQAKLKIGQPGDKYEREADAMANRVMQMSESQALRMQPIEEEEEMMQPKLRLQSMEEEEEMLQPKIQRQEEEEELLQPAIQKQQREEEEEQPLQMKCEECEQEDMVQTQPIEEEEEMKFYLAV